MLYDLISRLLVACCYHKIPDIIDAGLVSDRTLKTVARARIEVVDEETVSIAQGWRTRLRPGDPTPAHPRCIET
jgi:hypothetical protein